GKARQGQRRASSTSTRAAASTSSTRRTSTQDSRTSFVLSCAGTRQTDEPEAAFDPPAPGVVAPATQFVLTPHSLTTPHRLTPPSSRRPSLLCLTPPTILSEAPFTAWQFRSRSSHPQGEASRRRSRSA